MPYNVTEDLVQQEDSLQEAMLLQWYMSNVHHSILSTMTYVCPKYILSYLIIILITITIIIIIIVKYGIHVGENPLIGPRIVCSCFASNRSLCQYTESVLPTSSSSSFNRRHHHHHQPTTLLTLAWDQSVAFVWFRTNSYPNIHSSAKKTIQIWYKAMCVVLAVWY